MENVRDLYNQLCNGYNEFCITSSGRIRYQSTLSSYHTTKRAQLNIVTSIQKLISVEQQRIQNIQTVIDNYKKSIDEMYVTTRFTHQRQHYRTKDIKRQFKEAQSSLNDCTKRLGQLREARTKARESLEQVDCALEILMGNTSKSDKHRSALVSKQTQRVETVKKIAEQIKLVQKEHHEFEIAWHKRATLIFDECQKEELKRLDLIKKTLYDFSEAIQIKDQRKLEHIYHDMTHDIQIKQNSLVDITWWAKVHGIIDSDDIFTVLKIRRNQSANDNENEEEEEEIGLETIV
ncbi:unnamed protein product [Didymodactylos carnosus]|uniref:Uncharacterized protein n=1 Tax=Didymodactylos carnosus TaxID=1234261 RepID=A0A814CHR4_9BILA|nr:unnamed protein product [Didymodactylos carnosus]CAF3716972.1 unnamed protein product [Didymodactylos carnosus]